MSNPFDDLDPDDGTDATDDEPEGASDLEPETDPEPDSEPYQRSNIQPLSTETGSDQEGGSDPVDLSDTDPAFEYDAVRQKPLYARDETWNKLEDELGITVTPALRQRGIRNEEKREIHDALLEVVIEHIDEVPDRIAEKRLDMA